MLAKDVPLMLKKFKNVGKDDGLTHYEREFKVRKADFCTYITGLTWGNDLKHYIIIIIIISILYRRWPIQLSWFARGRLFTK